MSQKTSGGPMKNVSPWHFFFFFSCSLPPPSPPFFRRFLQTEIDKNKWRSDILVWSFPSYKHDNTHSQQLPSYDHPSQPFPSPSNHTPPCVQFRWEKEKKKKKNKKKKNIKKKKKKKKKKKVLCVDTTASFRSSLSTPI
eukprot:TRINITY_DN6363_c0_g1_i3.p1 TRINITY_DN6363_c0_g1~~TRINITY_DN6363_c0_g1_i3.p1  ORF type:complete len:139 (+),score=34.79 TRINITY_DN6363_c0_g1_i3:201-617(+)